MLAVYKCKMCGGELEVVVGIGVAECECCGTKQTLPKANEGRIQNLFNRANTLRLKCDFDKAEAVYEKILQEDGEEAEAYWGIVLCKYGIEYVEDPKTYRRIPTCHRTSLEAVMADSDYLAALQFADEAQQGVYEAEARAFDEIQKNILAIVKDEKPFDVFLCYKETDENGKRTVDSAIANEIYHQLTREGLKVFYAAITLENKLGQAYEPYIFAALNSAKVMLVLGTKTHYFTSVWVKNEWSRFMKLMKSDPSKLLIPCYRDMDAYELPEEFAHLQAQDMSKIGFINDVVRGIHKVILPDGYDKEKERQDSGVTPLLRRVTMFLEDGDWNSANEYCEKVLDINPECAQAYLGKLLAELQLHRPEELVDCGQSFDERANYHKTIRFADDELKTTITGYAERVNGSRISEQKDRMLSSAKKCMGNNIQEALTLLESLSGWKDADALAKQCREKLEEQKKEAARKRRIVLLTSGGVVAVAVFVILLVFVFIPGSKYAKAVSLMERKQYNDAIQIFESLDGYKDSYSKIQECQYGNGIYLMEEGLYEESLELFNRLSGLHARDYSQEKEECSYRYAVELENKGDRAAAAIYFGKAGTYEDARERSKALWGSVAVRESLDGSWYHTVGLKSDGTVVASGGKDYGQLAVNGWKNIVAISVGMEHTVGLRDDGTVVAVGSNEYGQCDVSGWKNIVAISAGHYHTIGLQIDGTTVYAGLYYSTGLRSDVVAISSGLGYTAKLKRDGTVVMDGIDVEQLTSDWTDIIAISVGDDHIVGLKKDGTVDAVGSDAYWKCKVSEWRNIVDVKAGEQFTVGLKSDGTVVHTGTLDYLEELSQWEDVVAIAAGGRQVIGLKRDGSVVVAGEYMLARFDKATISGWRDIKMT